MKMTDDEARAARIGRARRAGLKGGEARRNKGAEATRARHADPVQSDRIYDPDEEEFLRAMDAYIARRRRPFPTWCEALAVLKSLGYRRVQAHNERSTAVDLKNPSNR